MSVMSRTQNVFLVGLPGVGKSTIGKQLADALKLKFYDADREVEKRCGASIAWIFDIEGETGFRKREQSIIHDLTEKHGIVLATGGGVVLTPENRTRLSARGLVVYLESTADELVGRMEFEQRRPLLMDSSTRLDTLRQMAKERDPLYREIADFVINTTDRSVRAVVTAIVEQFNGHKG